MAAFSSSFQQEPFILDSTPNNNPSSTIEIPSSSVVSVTTTMDDDGSSPNSKENKQGKKKKPCKKIKKTCDDYIHVRARRGLAERVRREKISERMKMLQALVPGCEKVTGKAPMLDEIINYIHSLQYQTEFLSMRIATYYDFGADLESFMQDLSNLPSMEACSPTTAIDNYRGLSDDSATSLLLQQAQMPDVLPHAATSRQNLWEVDELRQRYDNEFSFH